MKKKADKPNVTINVNILSNIKLDGKSLICIVLHWLCLFVILLLVLNLFVYLSA